MRDGEALAMAMADCANCRGTGRRRGLVCRCVWRRVFRACWGRWRAIQDNPPRPRMDWQLLRQGGQAATRVWSCPDLDYAADFEMAARRVLKPAEWRLFRLHYLQGREYRDCARELRISGGRFWHEAYRIEEKLGRYFEALRPYALWPLRDYFGVRNDRRASSNHHIAAGSGGAGAERLAEGADERRPGGIRGAAGSDLRPPGSLRERAFAAGAIG